MNDISESKRKLCGSINYINKEKDIRVRMCCPITAAVIGMTMMTVLSGCVPRSDALIIEAGTVSAESSISAAESGTGGNAAGAPGASATGNRSTENSTGSVSDTGNGSADDAGDDSGTGSTDTYVYVHVCGAVRRPGVCVMKKSDHVCDAVKAAGGFTDDADEDYVNQAYPLSDGIKIVIPTKKESAGQSGGIQSPDGQQTGSAQNSDGRIDINTADETGLCEIPGVGAKRASDIIAYRTEHGSFKSIEDIKNVSGIKDGTFAKIKDHIKVE